MKHIGDKSARPCRRTDTKITWNQSGPQGNHGNPGEPGADGTNAADGIGGTDGLHCWDLNGNGIPELPDEDLNSDGQVNVLDCQGEEGLQGEQGPQGEAGPSGPAGPLGLYDSGFVSIDIFNIAPQMNMMESPVIRKHSSTWK